MYLNKHEVIGRITRDPELRTLPNGTAVVKFSVATNHVYKDKNGEKVETTQFHNCCAFGRLAETIGQYAKKGQEVYVCGRHEYRTWDKQDGSKGHGSEIVIDEFQFGQKPKGSEERTAGEAIAGATNEAGEVRLEDIPF